MRPVLNSSAETLVTAPVTLPARCVPYPVETISESVTATGREREIADDRLAGGDRYRSLPGRIPHDPRPERVRPWGDRCHQVRAILARIHASISERDQRPAQALLSILGGDTSPNRTGCLCANWRSPNCYHERAKDQFESSHTESTGFVGAHRPLDSGTLKPRCGHPSLRVRTAYRSVRTFRATPPMGMAGASMSIPG